MSIGFTVADEEYSGRLASRYQNDERRVLAEATNITKVYRRGNEVVRALDGVSVSIRHGDFLAISGPSGAGKSTLLHMLGCMDTPTTGTLMLGQQNTSGLGDSALTRLRREQVGFVFQHFGLLPMLTVTENVALPSMFSRRDGKRRAIELIEQVGLSHRANHRPGELSGGEMQRAAIARSLINSPELLMADEPTGNLDTANGEVIMKLFRELNAAGLTIVVVTHNTSLASVASRRIEMVDGKISAVSHELSSLPSPGG